MSGDGLATNAFGGPNDPAREALSEPLLDATAAAELLSVRPSWVYEVVRAGRLPHLKIGRHIRFLRSDLQSWVMTRRVDTSTKSPAQQLR